MAYSLPRLYLAAGLFLALALFGQDFAFAAEEASGDASPFDWRAFLAPFHSVTVHLPIGFLLLAAILDFYCLLRPSHELRKAVTLALILTAISAVVVAILGYLRAGGGGYDEASLARHQTFGIAVAALTCLIAVIDVMAYRGNGKPRLRAVYRILLLVNLVVVTIAGHQGGNLTHGSKYLVENAPDWVKTWLGETSGGGSASGADGTGSGVYAEKIQPVFEAKCYNCHGSEKQKGDYRLDNPEDALAAGESELAAIVPYRPMQSFLVELITLPVDSDEVMPPDGKEPLTAQEIVDVIEWIHMGAPFGDGEDDAQTASR